MKKQKNIFNIIIEGADGVGKSTLIGKIFDHYNFRYMCYHRGELSNYVFAKKFGREFYATQRCLPFIYIFLHCEKYALKERIIKRGLEEKWSLEEVEHELSKVDDVELFSKAAKEMARDYIIFTIDTTHLDENEVAEEAFRLLDNFYASTEKDTELSSWNKMYDELCKKYGLKFEVIDNQPYINGEPICVEATLHNGKYETFKNKKCYDNLMYAMNYPNHNVVSTKEFDIHYIINSKIKERPELYDYFKVIDEAGLKYIVSDNPLIEKSDNQYRTGRVFGEDYINLISKAKATIYCARDLAYLKLQTARLYEAIIANNVVFVDQESDKDCDMLNEIYSDLLPEEKEMMINYLYITPKTFIQKYTEVIQNDKLVNFILEKQHQYFDRLKKDFLRSINND